MCFWQLPFCLILLIQWSIGCFPRKPLFGKVGNHCLGPFFRYIAFVCCWGCLEGLVFKVRCDLLFLLGRTILNPHLQSFGFQTISLGILSFHPPSPVDAFHVDVGCRKSGLSNMVTPVPHHGKTGSRAAMHGSMTLSVAILAQFIVAQATFRDLRSDGNVA